MECIGRGKNTPVKPNRRHEKILYIYGTMVATSCDLNAPRCATTVPQVRLHGSRGGVFVGHRPPRDPGDPLQKIKVLHLFRWYAHTHKTAVLHGFPLISTKRQHPSDIYIYIHMYSRYTSLKLQPGRPHHHAG